MSGKKEFIEGVCCITGEVTSNKEHLILADSVGSRVMISFFLKEGVSLEKIFGPDSEENVVVKQDFEEISSLLVSFITTLRRAYYAVE